MLKIEHMQTKVTLYKDAVSDSGNGFGAMSMTRAKREILGWSDNDIKQDLLEQRMEKAASAEIANTASVIKHTGMFDKVDRIYGDINAAMEGGAAGGADAGGADAAAGGGASAAGLGGGFGGGGTTGEDLDFGDTGGGAECEEAAAATEAGGEATAAGEVGGAEDVAAETPETTAENIKKVENLLMERKNIISDNLEKRKKRYQDIYVNRLIEMVKNEEKPIESVKIYDKNVKINETINTMIKDIDDMLKD
jgi:hypothetical protein